MAAMALDLQMSKLNVADTLPNLNWGFQELRTRMSQFTVQFDAFIDRERKKALEQHNVFYKDVAILKEEQEIKRRDIEIATKRSATHTKLLAKESAEATEMRKTISSLTQDRSANLMRRDALAAELAALQRTLGARNEALAKQQHFLTTQGRLNRPELSFWEEYLCVSIHSGENSNRIRFVFSHVCDKDWDRQAMVDLEPRTDEYRVLKTRPKIDQAELDECLERYNEHRELGSFLRQLRSIFIRMLK